MRDSFVTAGLVRAVVNGILVGLVAANAWPLPLIERGCPISETGMDQAFYVARGVFAAVPIVLLIAVARLRRSLTV
ncbi:MAG: hypothetical protein WDM86_19145 [Rhizomicrobium sp.]